MLGLVGNKLRGHGHLGVLGGGELVPVAVATGRWGCGSVQALLEGGRWQLEALVSSPGEGAEERGGGVVLSRGGELGGGGA